tara:strand:+ start:421965 stop:422945 length:981 start_codon:yes stop_codon:yes gene_type:complete
MGTYISGFREVNLLDVQRPLGFPVPRWARWLRLKEWQAMQLDTPVWFVCAAVYNTKSIGTAIVMAFNKEQQVLYRYEHKVPCWKLHVPKGLYGTRCHYSSRNLDIAFNNRLDDGQIDVAFSAAGFAGNPDIAFSLGGAHVIEPIVILQPFAKNRPLYSHKALMPAQGRVIVDGVETVIEATDSALIVDDHKGYYPYTMQYDWVTGIGRTPDGGLIGFNLTDNQVQHPERFNENCLWVDGQMQPLSPVKIERPGGVAQSWFVRDAEGRVDLQFTPLADVPIKLNLGIARMDYHGPTGRLDGFILNRAGEKVVFDGCYGMGEQKLMRL